MRGAFEIDDQENGAQGSFVSLKHVHDGSGVDPSRSEPWDGETLLQITDPMKRTFTFDIWARAHEAGTEVRLFLFCKDINGNTTEPMWKQTNFTPIGEAWQKLSLTHTCPEVAKEVSVRMDVKDMFKTVWWDNIHVYRNDNLFAESFKFPSLQSPFDQGAFRGTIELEPSFGAEGTGSSMKHTSTGNPGEASYPKPWDGENVLTIVDPAKRTFTLDVWAKAEESGTKVRILQLCRSQWTAQTHLHPFRFGQWLPPRTTSPGR